MPQFKIGDITIGRFETLQSYGDRPEVYHARYGIRAHNGLDIACPTQTPVLAAASGRVIRADFDTAGYGYVIKILHEGFITTYGHLNDIAVKVDDHVVAGQLIGHSNNTGVSDTPHLHFGIAPCDVSGTKILQDNGYGGYIDPIGSEVEWRIENRTEPVYPGNETKPTISIDASELSTKQTQSNNYQTIINFAQSAGLDTFLRNEFPQNPVIDLTTDTEGGQHVNMWISQLLLELKNRSESINQAQKITEQPRSGNIVQKPGIKKNGIWDRFASFMFTED